MIPHPSKEYEGLAWADMSWREVERAAKEGYLALLPLGSVEQHGPMLPVGCDVFIASLYGLEGAKRARDKYGVKTLVLPPVPFGIACHHTDFPGTVSLDLKLYVKLLQKIVREVVRAGFKRIACVSGHGGNIIPAHAAMKELADQLYQEGIRDVKLYVADEKNCFAEANHTYGKMKQGQFGFHADAVETSMYLAIRPDLVKKEGMVKPKVKVKKMPFHEGWRTKEITETGASGDPTKANAEYGGEILKNFPDAVAAFLDRVAKD